MSNTSNALKMASCLINDASDNCAVRELVSTKIVKTTFAIAKA